MNMSLKKSLGWVLVVLVSSCVDPYRPPEITAPNSYLVVDGFLDSGPGTTTTIRLSRTQNVSDTKAPTAETRAQVTIESDRNETYRLNETTTGVYSITGLSPQTSQKYRLRIRTARGTDYLSDFVAVKPTPAIEAIGWRVENDGVQLFLDTRDPQNNTRYYRWEFEETWRFTAGYQSFYEIVNKQVLPRLVDIYRCWASNRSTNIILGSSARLNQDVINDFPLTFIPGSSAKLGIRYSILVRQYALTREAYEYWDQLAKTTQSLGSLFDPQPTQVTGNVRSVSNPNEPVLGYFGAGSVATKRIYINRSEIPFRRTITGYESCVVDTLTLPEVMEQNKFIIDLNDDGRFFATSDACVDCRLRGTNVKPAFWED